MCGASRRQFLARMAAGAASSASWVSLAETVQEDASRDGRPRGDEEPRIIATAVDQDVATRLKPAVAAGKKRVERFFGAPFGKPFHVVIHPNRSEFDWDLREHYQIPKPQGWMVALGAVDRMVMLSPRVWETEAVEHDPGDDRHVRELVAHELVHVYHCQQCPRPDFDGMDDLGWFIEGLAVVVSGQLEHSHRGRALIALKEGRAPKRLAEAWSGRDRYGVSGSIVNFVDRRYGRATTRKLLTVTTNDQALALLGTDESALLAAWKADLTGNR